MGENLRPARVLVLWAGGHGRLPLAFHAAPGGCLAVLSHWSHSMGGGQGAVLGTRFSALGIPDTTGHRGRAENRMGALEGGLVSPGAEGRRGQKERGLWMVPTRARVPGLVCGLRAGRPSGRRLDRTR